LNDSGLNYPSSGAAQQEGLEEKYKSGQHCQLLSLHLEHSK